MEINEEFPSPKNLLELSKVLELDFQKDLKPLYIEGKMAIALRKINETFEEVM
jgi:hypothetical protein